MSYVPSCTIVGVDLGSLQDHSAIAVVQQQAHTGDSAPRDQFSVALGWQEPPAEITHYYVRSLEQLSLGTAYSSIARRVTLICSRIYNRDSRGAIYVVVDATGVGRPVLEQIREIMIPQAHVCGVTLTASALKKTSTLYSNEVSCGKAYLARRLQIIIQQNRLHWHKNDPLATVLRKEFMDYQIRVTKSENDQYGAFTAGAHDDIITAVGLASLEDTPADVTYTRPVR